MLINLDREVQRKILQMFHFALRPGGFLFLGTSECDDACHELFAPVDKRNRIFHAKTGTPNSRRTTVAWASWLSSRKTKIKSQGFAMAIRRLTVMQKPRRNCYYDGASNLNLRVNPIFKRWPNFPAGKTKPQLLSQLGFRNLILTMTYSHMGKPHTTIGDASFHC